MSVRKVVTRRSCHFRGYFPSLKNGKPTPWESQLEGGFFRLLELSPQVHSYTIQPSRESVSLDSATIKYFPDLHVFLITRHHSLERATDVADASSSLFKSLHTATQTAITRSLVIDLIASCPLV